MIKAVIDTNVFIASIGYKSPFRIIFDKLKEGYFILSVSNDIIYEYYEIISRKTTKNIAENIINYLNFSKSMSFVNIYYKWNLIDIDKADNKFVDCYLSSNSDYLVTEDKHFDFLKSVSFPRINIVRASEFIELIKP